MSEVVVIKMFGLPRTCTNVVEVMLTENFDNVRVLTNTPCWKHEENQHPGRRLTEAEHGVATDSLRFVVCTKHPHQWLMSLYEYEERKRARERKKGLIRKLKNRPLGFDQFLARGSMHYPDETPVDSFNRLNRSWLTMHSEPDVLQVVRYEDLREHQIEIMERLEQAFGLSRSAEQLKVIEKRIDPNTKVRDEVFVFERRGHFTNDLVQAVNRQLDADLIQKLDYSLPDSIEEEAAG